MSARGLKALSGKSQAEREANAQARRATCRSKPMADRFAAIDEGLNYNFQGGFGGLFYGAKKKVQDENTPPEARALFQEAIDWSYAAFKMEKVGRTDAATSFAVKAATAVSRATGIICIGWVGDAGLGKDKDASGS